MRFALALLMVLHGITHLAGFAGSFRLSEAANIPYKTTVLGGRVDLGNGGIRVMGILWLVLAFVFVVVAAGTALDTTWWVRVAAVVATLSLAMTLLEMPQARIGLFVNLAILAALLFSY